MNPKSELNPKSGPNRPTGSWSKDQKINAEFSDFSHQPSDMSQASFSSLSTGSNQIQARWTSPKGGRDKQILKHHLPAG